MYLRRNNGDQRQARQQCLDRLVTDMLKAGARRLVLDSREDRDRYNEAVQKFCRAQSDQRANLAGRGSDHDVRHGFRTAR